MDASQFARDQENEAYGTFLIETIAKSAGIPGANPKDIDRAIYKGTACGAWVRFDADGIKVGTIVEGSDAEFSKRIDLTGVDMSDKGEKLLCERFWAAVQEAEDFSDEVWAELGQKEYKPMDDEDADYCPETKDHKHNLENPTIQAADGYSTSAEGGIVVDIWCTACGRSGSTIIRLEDINW
jgi:hypothetical protein